MFVVYRYINKKNGKVYVGYTRNLLVRNEQHHNLSEYVDYLFYRAVRKYGWENFEGPKILFTCKTEKQAKQKEIWWIKKLQSFPYGYNMTPGGDGNSSPRSVETRKKISVSLTGKTLSEETKKKISLKSTGRKHSKVSKRKMSLLKMGHTTSEETKQKISQALMGHRNFRN